MHSFFRLSFIYVVCSVNKKGSIIPLHPESASIPITCKLIKITKIMSATENAEDQKQSPCVHSSVAHAGMHDLVFNVIFSTDSRTLMEFVHGSAVRLYSITRCNFLSRMMKCICEREETARKQQHALAAQSRSAQDHAGKRRDCLDTEEPHRKLAKTAVQSCNVQEQELCSMHQSRTHHSMDVLKALFFLFLNVDMVLKEYACRPGSKQALAAAMNIVWTPAEETADRWSESWQQHNKQKQQQQKPKQEPPLKESEERALKKMRACRMLGIRAMDPAKAASFFTVLHDKIVRMWLQDERLHAGDLVKMVKEEYLVC